MRLDSSTYYTSCEVFCCFAFAVPLSSSSLHVNQYKSSTAVQFCLRDLADSGYLITRHFPRTDNCAWYKSRAHSPYKAYAVQLEWTIRIEMNSKAPDHRSYPMIRVCFVRGGRWRGCMLCRFDLFCLSVLGSAPLEAEYLLRYQVLVMPSLVVPVPDIFYV